MKVRPKFIALVVLLACCFATPAWLPWIYELKLAKDYHPDGTLRQAVACLECDRIAGGAYSETDKRNVPALANKAAICYRKLEQLYPDWEEPKRRLASLHDFLGHPDLAVRLLEPIQRGGHATTELVSDLIYYYYRAGQIKKCGELIEATHGFRGKELEKYLRDLKRRSLSGQPRYGDYPS